MSLWAIAVLLEYSFKLRGRAQRQKEILSDSHSNAVANKTLLCKPGAEEKERKRGPTASISGLLARLGSS